MTPTTKKELKLLLKQYETDPLNLDLINSIAIGYFENPEVLEENEDELFFERAYSIKKTVKSINNYAWYLKHVNEDIDKALEIQKECIDLNPKSYMPYNQYGFMLLEQNQYEKALEYLLKANSITKKRDTINNIGYCYFKLGNYEKAYFYFLEGSNLDDDEKVCLYNLALTEYKLGKIENLKVIAKKLEDGIETTKSEGWYVSVDDIGSLYCLADDFKSAFELLLNRDLNTRDYTHFEELSYALYLFDKNQWISNLSESICDFQERIDQILCNHEDWQDLNEEEKEELISDNKKEIALRNNLLKNGLTKPYIDIEFSIKSEHCGCLLFDCKRHENIDNDY